MSIDTIKACKSCGDAVFPSEDGYAKGVCDICDAIRKREKQEGIASYTKRYKKRGRYRRNTAHRRSEVARNTNDLRRNLKYLAKDLRRAERFANRVPYDEKRRDGRRQLRAALLPANRRCPMCNRGPLLAAQKWVVKDGKVCCKRCYYKPSISPRTSTDRARDARAKLLPANLQCPSCQRTIPQGTQWRYHSEFAVQWGETCICRKCHIRLTARKLEMQCE